MADGRKVDVWAVRDEQPIHPHSCHQKTLANNLKIM
jgi:hypothetical protein